MRAKGQPVTGADQDKYPADPKPLELEAYGWVVRFVSGQASVTDIAALKQWSAQSPSHAAAFDNARRTWTALDPERRRKLSENVVPLRPALNPSVATPSRLGRRAFLGGAIAASIAGAAVVVARRPLDLWPSLTELVADYRTETGERRQVRLADNISVDMNTQTSIALRSSPANSDRFELISGEALISAPETPVTVLASEGRVIASNARFNIRHIGQSVCVTCLHGSIEVITPGMATALHADRQVVYSAGTLGDLVTVDPAVATAWKDGIVIFDRTPVSDVVAEINRYRQGKVILTNAALGRELFNARFGIQIIDSVVGQIAQVFNVKVRNLPAGIVLLG